MTWQPIETARRAKLESKPVLIGWAGDARLTMEARWTTHPDYEGGKVPTWVGFDGCPGYTPTHWQPLEALPPPPED